MTREHLTGQAGHVQRRPGPGPTVARTVRREDGWFSELRSLQQAMGNQRLRQGTRRCPAVALCPTGGACEHCALRSPGDADDATLSRPDSLSPAAMATAHVSENSAAAQDEEPRPGEAPDEPWDDQEALAGRPPSTDSADPANIRSQLGPGRPLDAGVRSRMESAFGAEFQHVRIHTETDAAGLASSLNARAFTLGRDVAFAGGEYRPGTPVGDALIAHELAHVLQQRGRTETPATSGAGGDSALEEDADRGAAGAMATLWGGASGFGAALPRLRSGLHLQRCTPSSGGSTRVTVGNFRNRGDTGPENQCPLCPLPLGILAGSGKNRMELRGDITGHQAANQYDFKRTKERGTWKKVGAAWTQTSHVGPGADDDSHDSDEDLNPENDHIFAEDGPGFRDLADPVSDAAATEAVYKASFVEWVNVRAGTGAWSRASNEYQWHSVTWLEEVGGAWRRKPGANEIEPGSSTVGTGNP